MATSGQTSIAVTSWNTLTFRWERIAQSIANNTSTISWTMTLTSTSSGAISSSAQKTWSVKINGNNYSGTNTVGIAANSSKILASGNLVIPHNADGSKTFSYSFSQEFNITFSGDQITYVGDSDTGILNTIFRKAVITSAPNFTDEGNPTITYSNAGGNTVTSLQACISLTGNIDDIPYREISKTGTSYTFTLTEAEREILRKATANSRTRTVYFYLATTIGDVINRDSVAKTLTIANAVPDVDGIVFDVNEKTIALTGSNGTMVKYHSQAEYYTSAIPKKSATIKSYSIINGSQTSNLNVGTFTNVDSGKFTFYVTDSRGNTKSATVEKNFIEYIKPTCNLEVDAPTLDGEESKVNISIRGNCFNGSFGAKNNLLQVQYRVKQNDGEYSIWFTTPSYRLDGNSYSCDFSLSGLDYISSYTIQARAIDLLEEVNSVEIKMKVTPVFDWGANDFNFNVPISISGEPVADFVIEQGSNDYWYYKKWQSGIVEMWGWCEATYGQTHYLSTYEQFPIELKGWISALGTINNFGGNLSAYLPINVKVECFNYGCNVWVQNSNNSFVSSDKAQVSIHVIGRWK